MGADVIAIIGGGPAGAFAAELLACARRKVLLLDEKLAWERPCGGGLTHKTLQAYSFLRDGHEERNWVRGCELTSPSGRSVYLELDRPIAIFSRHVLNGLLLYRAVRAGAEVVRERVTAVRGKPRAWELHTIAGTVNVGFVVFAVGARSSFRAQFSRPFAAEDLMVTAGYYVPGSSTDMQVRFFAGLDGYAWLFPRSDHYSAGICGKLGATTTAELRRLLHVYLREQGITLHGASFYSHLLPSPTSDFLQHAGFSGPGWAMIGDAAGFVDAITGEGLYYALRSAELLAKAQLAGRPELYAECVRQDFLPELITAAGFVDRFFRGKFAGAPVLERMVQFAARSSHFRLLLADLFAGSQGYCGLRRRAWSILPLVLAEMAFGRMDAASRSPMPPVVRGETTNNQRQDCSQQEQPVPCPDVEEMD